MASCSHSTLDLVKSLNKQKKHNSVHLRVKTPNFAMCLQVVLFPFLKLFLVRSCQLKLMIILFRVLFEYNLFKIILI